MTRLDPRKGKFEVQVEVDETAETETSMTETETEEGFWDPNLRSIGRMTATEKTRPKKKKATEDAIGARPPRRLELAEKLVGAHVKLRGLAARADLNGRVGVCVRFVAARAVGTRWRSRPTSAGRRGNGERAPENARSCGKARARR